MGSTGKTTVTGSSLPSEVKVLQIERALGTRISSVLAHWLILNLHIKPLTVFFNLEECLPEKNVLAKLYRQKTHFKDINTDSSFNQNE